MTAYRVTKVDDQGHTLRSDVAAAYFRALADGMPTGGIDVFQRTMAEQQTRYDAYRYHGGPIAAPPSLHAPHVDNRAFDTHTTTNNRYAPSAAHKWLTEGTEGSKPPRETNDGKMRARAYGFARTVPGERWHFEYERQLDGKREADLNKRIAGLGYKSVKEFQAAHDLNPDGVDGPFTWGALLNSPTAKPTTEEPPVVSTDVVVKVSSLNIQAKRWGGGKYADDASFIAAELDPDVLMGQEAEEIARIRICEKNHFKVWPMNYLGIFWDPKLFANGPELSFSFDDRGIHGCDGVKLTSLVNHESFVVASVHIRPTDAFGSVAKAKLGKKTDIAKVIKFLAQYDRVVVGGDWSSDAKGQMEDAGYVLVTPHVDTYDKPGDQRLDGIFARGFAAEEVKDPEVDSTKTSDHHAVSFKLLLRKKIQTN